MFSRLSLLPWTHFFVLLTPVPFPWKVLTNHCLNFSLAALSWICLPQCMPLATPVKLLLLIYHGALSCSTQELTPRLSYLLWYGFRSPFLEMLGGSNEVGLVSSKYGEGMKEPSNSPWPAPLFTFTLAADRLGRAGHNLFNSSALLSTRSNQQAALHF